MLNASLTFPHLRFSSFGRTLHSIQVQPSNRMLVKFHVLQQRPDGPSTPSLDTRYYATEPLEDAHSSCCLNATRICACSFFPSCVVWCISCVVLFEPRIISSSVGSFLSSLIKLAHLFFRGRRTEEALNELASLAHGSARRGMVCFWNATQPLLVSIPLRLFIAELSVSSGHVIYC